MKPGDTVRLHIFEHRDALQGTLIGYDSNTVKIEYPNPSTHTKLTISTKWDVIQSIQVIPPKHCFDCQAEGVTLGEWGTSGDIHLCQQCFESRLKGGLQ